MDVKVAKTAGFCFGVKRAVEEVYRVAEVTQGAVYTYGPIIHNEEVVSDLEKKGVKVLETEEELKNLTKGTVISVLMVFQNIFMSFWKKEIFLM